MGSCFFRPLCTNAQPRKVGTTRPAAHTTQTCRCTSTRSCFPSPTRSLQGTPGLSFRPRKSSHLDTQYMPPRLRPKNHSCTGSPSPRCCLDLKPSEPDSRSSSPSRSRCLRGRASMPPLRPLGTPSRRCSPYPRSFQALSSSFLRRKSSHLLQDTTCWVDTPGNPPPVVQHTLQRTCIPSPRYFRPPTTSSSGSCAWRPLSTTTRLHTTSMGLQAPRSSPHCTRSPSAMSLLRQMSS